MTANKRNQRIALADLLLTWDGVWRVISYTEFVTASRRDDAHAVIQPARSFLTRLTAQQASAVLDATTRALRALNSATGVHVADPIVQTPKTGQRLATGEVS